jgi:uncharacterized membrane protein
MSRGSLVPFPVFHRHPRIWIGLAIGIAVFLLLPRDWSLISRIVLAWDCGVTFFLLAIYLWIRNLTSEQICSHCSEEDPSGAIMLVVVTAAALLSLLAIVALLATVHHVEQRARLWHVLLAGATLIDSWLLVPAMFTTHYADRFYGAPRGSRPLSFPQTPMPVFWDFAYFSFTIAAACQTADVLTTEPSIRRVVIAQEIIALVFNTAILGFAINITAGLIGS